MTTSLPALALAVLAALAGLGLAQYDDEDRPPSKLHLGTWHYASRKSWPLVGRRTPCVDWRRSSDLGPTVHRAAQLESAPVV